VGRGREDSPSLYADRAAIPVPRHGFRRRRLGGFDSAKGVPATKELSRFSHLPGSLPAFLRALLSAGTSPVKAIAAALTFNPVLHHRAAR
jgi:hypothetical protein